MSQSIQDRQTPEAAELNSQHATHTGQLGAEDRGYNEAATPAASTPATPAKLGRGFWLGVIVAAIVLASIVVYGIHSRADAEHNPCR